MASKPQVTLTFAGDASALERAAQRAAASTTSVGEAAQRASDRATQAGRDVDGYGDRMARAGAAAAGMSAAIGDASGTVSALAALQNRGADRAAEQARALLDVEQAGADAEQALGDLRQAQLDLNQAQIDAKQASADAEQALLDVKQAGIDAERAQQDYNTAVREHGANSIEARQAALDLAQAQQDLKQAGIDAEQAEADLAQAHEDAAQAARDMTQAGIDAEDAQLRLNEAQRAADPSALTRVGKEMELAGQLAMGLVGTLNLLVMAQQAVTVASIRSAAATGAARAATLAGAVATGVATAAQWLWNVAMTANPIGLIIVAIGALVAAIVWIATQTTWFQDLWRAVWGKIGDPVKAAWDWIKQMGDRLLGWFKDLPGEIRSAFSKLTDIITWPYRSAFNFISRAWNATVGQLSWTVPGWVPIVGGNTVSAPTLPEFHRGGRVPGAPGTEVPIMALAGETVLPPGESAAGPTVIEIRSGGSRLDDLVVDVLMRSIRTRPDLRVAIRTAVG